MTILLTLVSFFLVQPITTDLDHGSKHLGKWNYEVVAPDYTYKGVMELTEVDGELGGTIKSEGVSIPLEEVTIEGDELQFKMNVQGFPCVVKGMFEGDTLKGNVEVEGMSMPLTASRA